jgi:hypothetical protein
LPHPDFTKRFLKKDTIFEGTKMSNKLTRNELITLVEKIMECNGNEAEMGEWIITLKDNVPHPAVSDLIFYSEKELTPEEVVDRALAYKPFILGSSSQ